MTWRKLSDEHWQRIKEHLPPPQKKPKGGRPPAEGRRCFEGILWILWTGAQWSELPRRYGPKSTVHDRLQRWTRDGSLEKLWRAFLAQLQDQEQIRWDECFVDGTFVPAKKGGLKSATPSGARARSLWYWLMARVLRLDFTWRRRPRRR